MVKMIFDNLCHEAKNRVYCMFENTIADGFGASLLAILAVAFYGAIWLMPKAVRKRKAGLELAVVCVMLCEILAS